MALGTQFDFAMHRGDNRTISFTVVDQQNPAVPVDLTGLKIEWTFSLKAAGSVAPLGLGILSPNKSVGAGITLIDAANGKGEIELLSVDTTGRVAQAYYHELQLQVTGQPSTVMFGVMTLAPELLAPGP